MKAAFTIVGVIIVIVLFGTMITGIRTAQTEERLDAFTGVTTGAGENEADVILVTDVYGNDILNVVEIISDNGLDAPLPDSYTSGNNSLTVRGLAASDTRSLDVTYRYDALTGDSAAAGTFLGMVPIFVGIAVVVILVAAGVAAWSARGG